MTVLYPLGDRHGLIFFSKFCLKTNFFVKKTGYSATFLVIQTFLVKTKKYKILKKKHNFFSKIKN